MQMRHTNLNAIWHKVSHVRNDNSLSVRSLSIFIQCNIKSPSEHVGTGGVCARTGQSVASPSADREIGAFLKFATTDVCEWADQEKDPRADPLIYSLTTARIAFK